MQTSQAAKSHEPDWTHQCVLCAYPLLGYILLTAGGGLFAWSSVLMCMYMQTGTYRDNAA